jgi:hypothetical protein
MLICLSKNKQCDFLYQYNGRQSMLLHRHIEIKKMKGKGGRNLFN